MEYGQTYQTTAPTELVGALLVDLYGLQAALQRYPGNEVQQQLRQVGALLCAFMAQSVANLGYLREARRWWRTARRTADASADRYSMLWIRGREIVRAGYEHRPMTVIMQLIDEAEARVANAPVAVVPQLLAGKAQTLALLGPRMAHETVQTLGRLREAFSALPAALATPADSLFAWGEERLHFTESFVYAHLGDFDRAAGAQDTALALYPAHDVRGPAQIELQRALCLARAGDGAQAAQHAQRVVSTLPSSHRVRPIADLGQRVLRAIPAPEHQRASVREYRECLRSAFVVPVRELSSA